MINEKVAIARKGRRMIKPCSRIRSEVEEREETIKSSKLRRKGKQRSSKFNPKLKCNKKTSE